MAHDSWETRAARLLAEAMAAVWAEESERAPSEPLARSDVGSRNGASSLERIETSSLERIEVRATPGSTAASRRAP